MRAASRVVLLLAWLLPWCAWALSSDKQQPIHIEADSVVIDDAHGTAVYKGNVHYSQGSTHLEADEVTVYSTDRQNVDKVVATGDPATFRQRPDNQDQEMRGQAGQREYYAAAERVVLIKDAHLWQGKNEFAGNRIEYDTARQTVKALNNGDESGRVQVIIQPHDHEQSSASPTPAAP
ncbi:MAG: lipopolysaccharide transport periplasmic protein LptA [Gammaproteobacteria bacterium]